MSETNLLLIPDHAAVARSRTLSALRRPRMLALLDALAAGVQELEEIQFGLIVSRTLGASGGAQLDQWGALVGEPRLGADDPTYRRFIEARILVNINRSTPDELIRLWAKITGPNLVRYRDVFPACFALETTRGSFMSGPTLRRVRRMMIDVKPIGVAMYRVEALIGGFGFEGSPGDPSPYSGFDAGGFARSF